MYNKTCSDSELKRVDIYPRSDGYADIYLNKNIKEKKVKDEDGEHTVYTADQAFATSTMSGSVEDMTAEIEADFDAYFEEYKAWTPAEEKKPTAEQNAADIAFLAMMTGVEMEG